MLVLSRHIGEAIQIGDSVTVVVTDVQRRGGKDPTVRLGIEAPAHVAIVRTELLEDCHGTPDGDDE